MVAELDALGLHAHPVAVEVGDDVDLVDVEAEVVERSILLWIRHISSRLNSSSRVSSFHSAW